MIGGILASAASADTTGSTSVYTAVTPFRVLGSSSTGQDISAGGTTNVQITGEGSGSSAVPTGRDCGRDKPDGAGPHSCGLPHRLP